MSCRVMAGYHDSSSSYDLHDDVPYIQGFLKEPSK